VEDCFGLWRIPAMLPAKARIIPMNKPPRVYTAPSRANIMPKMLPASLALSFSELTKSPPDNNQNTRNKPHEGPHCIAHSPTIILQSVLSASINIMITRLFIKLIVAEYKFNQLKRTKILMCLHIKHIEAES